LREMTGRKDGIFYTQKSLFLRILNAGLNSDGVCIYQES
jgi:hypothetical protein